MFIDRISGSKAQRPELDKCMTELQVGDTLIIWRLDRLVRSMGHLVSLIEKLREKGIGFKSICDGAIDTTTAQFERRLIQERTRAGLEAARNRGIKWGRKRIESAHPKVIIAKKMY